MKVPKTTKRFCKYCGKHTEHKISISKSGFKRGSLKRGSIQRALKRSVPGTGNKIDGGLNQQSQKEQVQKHQRKQTLNIPAPFVKNL